MVRQVEGDRPSHISKAGAELGEFAAAAVIAGCGDQLCGDLGLAGGFGAGVAVDAGGHIEGESGAFEREVG